MISDAVIENLKKKYNHVHPLIFHRSIERAETAGDLFDALEALPNKLPILWSDEEHKWVCTDDLTQSHRFDLGN